MERLRSKLVIVAGSLLTGLLALFSPSRTAVEVSAQTFVRTTSAAQLVGGVVQSTDILALMSPYLVVVGFVAGTAHIIKRRL